MSIPSAELVVRIAEIREKCRNGTATQDDMREAIVFLRAERTAMPPPTTRAKAKVVPISTENLFDELDNL